jgi:hypothetical protein
MPKVTIEFHLPEEQREYEVCTQANNMQSFIWDFCQQLRSWQKYGHNFKNADDALSKIRDEFYVIINDNQVNIDL